MKRLWKRIPPCMSDILGFQAVLNHTDGMGIVDDSSNYKPLQHEKKGDYRPGGGHHGGRQGKGGGLSVKGKLFSGVRIISSEIEEADVITGTAEKLRGAVAVGMEKFQPDFALLTTAPCASMIGTDLDEIADEIQAKRHIPAGVVKLDGQKDYQYGISYTLEAMGKLLLEPRDSLPKTVNLLGCNTIDWSETVLLETERWLNDAGFTVLSRWGMEETTERLQNAAAASVNLVVTAAGLRLARYMEREFQIPYVTGAPFGAKQCSQLLNALETGTAPSAPPSEASEPEVLVLGEQLTGNAIRSALAERGIQNVRVFSFFDMDKAQMQPGDKKLISEDELSALLNTPSLRAVFGDRDYQLKQDIPWIALPNQGNNAPSQRMAPFSMVGDALDTWLDKQPL